MNLTLGGRKHRVKVTDENASEFITTLKEELEKRDELVTAARESQKAATEGVKALLDQIADLKRSLKNTKNRETYHRKAVEKIQASLEDVERASADLRLELHSVKKEVKEKLTSLRLYGDRIALLKEENAQLTDALAKTKQRIAPFNQLRAANEELLATYENLTAKLTQAEFEKERAEKGAEYARAELKARSREMGELRTKLQEGAGIFKNMLDRSFGRIVSSSGKVKSPFSKRKEFDMVLEAYDKHIRNLLKKVG